VNNTFPPLTIQKGIVHIGNRPRLFISADYPYYRDDANNWRDRLASLKSLGMEVISVYIPWRHHQTDPETAPDFLGISSPNRNVTGFLSLCADLGLMVIAKPGPFIHAEVNYGGLPDWTCPANNPKIEALLNSDDKPEYWSGARLSKDGKSAEAWPLPAPFSPEFLRLTREWLERVGAEVILPNQAPGGPIVAVQVGNEGIYSNGQHAPWSYDYSPSALEKYLSFLQNEYHSIENYNNLHGTPFQDWREIPAPRDITFPLPARQTRMLEDWGVFVSRYMDEIFGEWSAPLGTDLPVILNQNPPLEAHFGLDAWLTRVEPERWKGVYYGFTNWVGDVSANPSAFDRYILTAKRFPGPNMEENWGFAELYDPAYVDASTSFYQTLSILNNGATGFNVYTGVGTAHADRNMEILRKIPYPDAAPISANGSLTPKAEIVRWLVMFFERYGEEFLASRPAQPVAWGLYLPHARVAVWSPANDKSAPQHGETLREFQKQMRHLHLDYGVLNLETVDVKTFLEYAFVFLAGGDCMAADVQQKLTDYASNGGRLMVLGHIPRLDENGASCEILWNARASLQSMPEAGYAALLGGLQRPTLADGQADIWVRSHPERDLHFVTLLIPAHGKPRLDATLEIGTRRQRVVLSATPSGGALLRIENGRITDAIIKGHNAYLGQSVAPHCQLDHQTVGQDQPGDFIQVGSWSANLVPEKPVKHAKKDKK
jgi:beta-galactosidase